MRRDWHGYGFPPRKQVRFQPGGEIRPGLDHSGQCAQLFDQSRLVFVFRVDAILVHRLTSPLDHAARDGSAI